MSTQTVKTVTIQGVNYEIGVTSDGRFWSIFKGDKVKDATLKGLEKKLLRKAKLSSADLKIPYTYVDTRPYVGEVNISECTAVGIHAGNNNILSRVAGVKEPTQCNRHDRNCYRFTEPEKAELKRLAKEYRAAHLALHKFLDAHQIELGKEVEAAIAKSMEEDTKEPEPKKGKDE